MYNYGLGDDPSSPSLLEQSLEMAERMDESQSDPVVIKLEEYRDNVESVAYSPDGKYVCSGSMDNTVRLWNTETGLAVRTLNGHTDRVNSVSFSPDGRYICSGSLDETVRLWNSETGKTVRMFEDYSNLVKSVTFSPDGLYFCAGGNFGMQLYLNPFTTWANSRDGLFKRHTDFFQPKIDSLRAANSSLGQFLPRGMIESALHFSTPADFM